MKTLIKTCVFAFVILACRASAFAGSTSFAFGPIKPKEIDILDLIREGTPINEWPWQAVVATAFLVFCAVLVAFSWFHTLFYGNRCRKCKRSHALVKTGKTKVGQRQSSGDDCVMYQWKCKYCDNLTWQEKPEPVRSSE